MTVDAARLHAYLGALGPVVGVSVEDPEDAATWRVDFADDATEAQMTAVYAAVAAYDPGLSLTEEDFRMAIQNHVDQTARSRRYDGGFALASYVSSTIPQWSTEAQIFVAWRDAVWVYAYTELDKVLGGERSMPTVDEFISELPAIEWPEVE